MKRSILKIALMSFFSPWICAGYDAYGQSDRNGSYVGLEDMHYTSHEKHKTLKWYRFTRLTIKDDSVWVEQYPVALHKRDTIWSASDGAFFYFEGTIKANGGQFTIQLKMTHCDYCGIPADSAGHEKWSHRIWNGRMTNDGMIINGSFYSRSDIEAMRWRKLVAFYPKFAARMPFPLETNDLVSCSGFKEIKNQEPDAKTNLPDQPDH